MIVLKAIENLLHLLRWVWHYNLSIL
jgi:hypothetical protein